MKVKTWLISWLVIVVSSLSILGYCVYKVDPYFHYHKPKVDKYFYTLDNPRSQNNGISKYFDYDALITGTSMTENFRTSEADQIFGFHSIKVPFQGGTFKEINDNVRIALDANDKLKTVIRCLDFGMFFDKYDRMRNDLGTFPTYLYDNNPFNDVEYLLNRDIVFGRVYQMTIDNNKKGFKPGITSFDEYSRWQDNYTFGIDTACPDGISAYNKEPFHLTEEEKNDIKMNIEQNVTSIADEYPNVDFYYYYSPYSIAEWSKWKTKGTLHKTLEAEAYITELILPHKNIHLFSFNNRTDIITDLNNYKDTLHYATWINSLILKWMHEGQYQLTEDNYKDYLQKEYDFYTTFDFDSVNGQEDYEADYYAGALLNKELTGAEPLNVLDDDNVKVTMNKATYSDNNQQVVACKGALSRDKANDNLAEYLKDKEFIGIKFNVNLDDGYNYLSFHGQKIADQGGFAAYVYNADGQVVAKKEANYKNLDNEIHQYVIDLSTIKGNVTIVLHGGFNDSTGNKDSEYHFSKIYMY